MRATPYLLLPLLCKLVGRVLTLDVGGAPSTSSCKSTDQPTGPNDLQVAQFRSKLSDPTALETQFSYHYSASLITDGLANGTNPVYVYTMPRFIVTPTVPEDVVAAVQFAADYNLKVSALGGGHQLAGIALPHCGVTIQMYKLQGLKLDPVTNLTTVQAQVYSRMTLGLLAQMGVKTGTVARALTNKYRRLPMIGACFDVCVAGFALQGGLSLNFRYRGTAADFIQGMDVVTIGADRQAVRRTISAQREPDLFWGMRGAGGNLGVAIEYTTYSFAVPKNVQTAGYTFDFAIAEDVLKWYAGVVPKCPRSVYAVVTLTGAGHPLSVNFNNMGPQTSGTEDCFKALAAFAAPRALNNSQPGQSYKTQDYLEFAANISSGSKSSECPDNTAATYWNTYFTANDTSTTGTLPLGLIYAAIAQAKASPYSTFAISFSAGPSLPQGEDAKYFTANAWSFRDCYYVLVGDTWETPGGDNAAHISHMKTASAALKPFVAGNYINQLMMDDPTDAARSYEAGIFTRLQGVKAAYDPNNLFRDLHYVHPGAEPPTCSSRGDTSGSSHESAPGPLPCRAVVAVAPAPAAAMSSAEAPRPQSV